MEFAYFVTFLHSVLENWQRVVIGGAIVVCSLIVFLEILKGFTFDKISCKPLRKSLLALTSLILILPFTAVYFVIDKIDFQYYWVACIALAPVVIIVYWLYETTNLRTLVQKIGEHTWHRVLVALAAGIVEDDNKKTQEKLVASTKATQKYVEKELKAAASVLVSKHEDNELKNL